MTEIALNVIIHVKLVKWPIFALNVMNKLIEYLLLANVSVFKGILMITKVTKFVKNVVKLAKLAIILILV
jgi:hypothetical protein